MHLASPGVKEIGRVVKLGGAWELSGMAVARLSKSRLRWVLSRFGFWEVSKRGSCITTKLWYRIPRSRLLQKNNCILQNRGIW